eukprot:10866574-Alexandrium_andersonii.AAC.1
MVCTPTKVRAIQGLLTFTGEATPRRHSEVQEGCNTAAGTIRPMFAGNSGHRSHDDVLHSCRADSGESCNLWLKDC